MTSPSHAPLPDPFATGVGGRVRTAAEWEAQRALLLQRTVPLAYGELPPAPARTEGQLLNAAVLRHMGEARLASLRVLGDGAPICNLRLILPAGEGPFPVLVNGDACWHYATDDVLRAVLGRGMGLALFNRTEIASDLVGTVQNFAPALAGRPGPALAAWAWGYHRVIDVLQRVEGVDTQRIAVVGHSRGGKASLLAGATDTRIALTSANNSGAGGAGCFRWQGPQSETLEAIVRGFPHWFGPGLAAYAGREAELPFDQHFLKALVAPRALLTTEAFGDPWANPEGSWQTHQAAREVYRFLGAEERIAIAFRQGGHEHSLADWLCLLDFCDAVFRGKPHPHAPDIEPFPGLPAAFGWRSPLPTHSTP